MSNTGIELIIPCGDYGFDVPFILTDSACAAFNLTGLSLVLNVWRPGKPKDLLLVGVMDITNPPGLDGLAYYTVVQGDFDVMGEYLASVQGTMSGVQISWETFDLYVTENG